jgi:CHASE2 domain-containing sensor protein
MPVTVQLLDVVADANVAAVLASIQTYAANYVAAVVAWMQTFIPVLLPIAGIAVAFYFGLRLFKRASRG